MLSQPLRLTVSLKRSLPLMYILSRTGNSYYFELYRTHVNIEKNPSATQVQNEVQGLFYY